MKQSLEHTAAIILAAGRGTRMKSKDTNKVAYKLDGRPMVAHTVDNLRQAGINRIIAVVGFQADSVREALGDRVDYVVQSEQLGTGNALSTAVPALGSDVQTVLLVYGDDSAFYPPELYQQIATKISSHQADLLVLTIYKDDPTGLGRIIRDSQGKIVKIVEEKNATPKEKLVKEINTGFYCFSRDFLVEYIDQIRPNPVTKEYYATDLVEIALEAGKVVETHFVKDASIWHGVNTINDYEQAKLKYKTEHA